MTLSVLTFIQVLFAFAAASVDPFYYPIYHLAPPKGWMNDPNGFCYFNGEYHLFYQYNEFSSQEPGIAAWGHAVSHNLVSWSHLPVAMRPDQSYDRDGVFSGSALIENNTMYLFYTGNVNHKGETPDHEQHQALAWSHDGVTVTKYAGNPIIVGANRQPNFRDPKVWKHEDTYYMVLGNSYDNDTNGQVLLYSSKDLLNWKEISILDLSFGYLGYMWECPDFFEIDGMFVLLFSPQGVKTQGIQYRNLYQTGYLVGIFDYINLKFTAKTEFVVLDKGHDFYATQTTVDKYGNRVLEAWLDMWEQVYPERNAGFTGQMTLARVLTLSPELRLLQRPVSQIRSAIGKSLFSGVISDSQVVPLENNTVLIQITAAGNKNFTLILEVEGVTFVTITFEYDIGLLTLDRGGQDGKRSAKWRPGGLLQWDIYVDKSSLELFTSDGEITFSSRIFPNGTINMRIGKSCTVLDVAVYSMTQTVFLQS